VRDGEVNGVPLSDVAREHQRREDGDVVQCVFDVCIC
jgi:hypothetical protein